MDLYKYLCFLIVYTLFNVVALASDRLPSDVQQHLLQGEYNKILPKLHQLANADNSKAQYQLALYYLKDKNNKVALAKAEQWLIKSAHKSHKASYLLGLLYMQNKFKNSSNSSNSKAQKYLQLAKDKGNFKAKKLLAKLQLNTNSSGSLNSSLQAQLFTSIKQGDLLNVKKLYALGAKLNTKNNLGDTPLISAIKNHQKDIAICLLTLPNTEQSIKKILNINAQDKKGNSALHIAALQNQFKISHLLFYNKASLNIQNKTKQTPLISAIIAKNKIIAQQLINEKANVKIKDAFGKTAIDYAKKYAIPLVFSSKHKKDENALSAEKQLKEKLNRLVLQTKDPKSPYFERSVLAIAVAQKQKELIPYLLTAGYSPWKGDLQHQNAVITAIIMKDHNTAITLLSRTIPKSIKQNKLVNTFAHAIKYDQLKVLTKLLEVVDTKNMAKWSIEQTPLWYAIKFNRIKAVISIMRKMPIDSRQGDYLKENTKENTINKGYLLLAMQSNLSEISQLLISNKVDINLQDEKGRTALWYAADFKNSDIMYQLLQAHTQINLADNQNITPLIQAVIKNCYRCVEQLITFGADTKKQTQNGNNALMFAAQGKDKLVKLFIDDKREFNIKARNNNSSTALMLSIKSNCIKCVQLLLNKGANPKRKNKQGEDSFDLSKNKPEILTLLNNY